MLTKGIILSKEPNSNLYTIRIPLLETAASSSIFTIQAPASIMDGVINPYNQDDVVFVSFENDEYDNPVIIGKLSKEGLLDYTREQTNASYSMNSLNVEKKAVLPADTKIGDTTYKDIFNLFQIVSNLPSQVQSDWAQTDTSATDYIKNKPTIPNVGDGTLTIQKNSTQIGTFTANTSSDTTINITVPTKTSDITNDSGFITSSALNGYATETWVTNKGYATETWVTNKGYLTSVSWSQVTGKPSFATVATTGSYNDLSGKPTIPSVGDGTLTIQQNGSTLGSFTANQSGNKTINIIAPTSQRKLYMHEISFGDGTHSFICWLLFANDTELDYYDAFKDPLTFSGISDEDQTWFSDGFMPYMLWINIESQNGEMLFLDYMANRVSIDINWANVVVYEIT